MLPFLLPLSTLTAQQSIGTVIGAVRESATALPIAGAELVIEASGSEPRAVARTDTAGRFRISSIPVGEWIVVARRLGFAPDTQPVTVRAQGETRVNFVLASRPIAVTMSQSTRPTLGEVIIIDTVATHLSAVAYGKVVGAAQIQGRGSPAMLASNNPLVVVDGYPLYNWYGPSRPDAPAAERLFSISSIDPKDIESIEILKNTAAVAVYGQQASSGAILVHTKNAVGGVDYAGQLLDWLLARYPIASVSVTPEHRAALELIESRGPLPLRRIIGKRIERRGGVYVRGDIAITNPDSLAQGSLAHNVPPGMRQGASVNVEAALARGKIFSTSMRLVGTSDTIFVSSLAVPKYADLVLEAESGDTGSFRIVPSKMNGVKEIRLDSINRILRDTMPVRWAWNVTPLRGGNFILRFILLGIRRDTLRADTLARVPVATVVVPVEVDFWFETRRQAGVAMSTVTANQWIYLGAVALLSALFAWLRSRGKPRANKRISRRP